MKRLNAVYVLTFLGGSSHSNTTSAFGLVARTSNRRVLGSRPLPIYTTSSMQMSSTSQKIEPSTKQDETSRLFPEELNVIYDSKCNVCKLEIDFLRQRDVRLNGQPKLRFTDLEGGLYDESDPRNGGISYAVGMSSMHAVTPAGDIMVGVPVFEKAYQQVQLGWLFQITRVPGFQQLANILYDIFAKYRTLLTRGSTVNALVEAYEAKKELEGAKQAAAANCDDNRCTPAVVMEKQ